MKEGNRPGVALSSRSRHYAIRAPLCLVGLSRFELLTPRLSSVCSNQLSYRPEYSLKEPLPVLSKLDSARAFFWLSLAASLARCARRRPRALLRLLAVTQTK